ncbi:hypothetical protein CBR_g50349 [Chara braunii]|uniref:Chlorophyll a-b binding protein, chloroplastic n=1 Tax=Chara braunii TaxID=69332 RepID=A0A388K5H9_CHABU|nr:hypothetical protein CBR_g50349 [Chara braunii]|eukprot:GBG65310.1 hypothetical protein CBR_g50349 [Chara braunii]
MAHAVCQAAAATRFGALSSTLSSSSTRVSDTLASSFNGARLAVKRVAATSRLTMGASWLPGSTHPEWLDGSSPGDFGFDPLGLAREPSSYERYKESELIHGRWAMMGVVGVLVPEALGYGNWVDAQQWAATPGGTATYLGNPVPWGNLPTILCIEALAIAFVESKRNDERDVTRRSYPGGAFDPMGFSKDAAKFEEYKVKEVKNGRLAMMAMLGFSIQALVRAGTGPLENLANHLADPWHHNIAEIVIPRTVL